MGVSKCLDCISSCCRLEVDLTKVEYDFLTSIGKGENITSRVDTFIQANRVYSLTKMERVVEQMFGDEYAFLNKSEDGYCELLNRKTRLCSIYENRPKVCRDFSNESKRCEFVCIN